jgi:hypothetical protein
MLLHPSPFPGSGAGVATGPFTNAQVAAMFGGGIKGAAYDFADGSRLSVNADGGGGTPALGEACRWAADLSPNANHLRNTVSTVTRRANGIETSGTSYGLFNLPGAGDWPVIPQPVTIVVRLEQLAFAGNNARLIWSNQSVAGLLQGPSSGGVQFYAGAYGASVNPGLVTESTIEGVLNGSLGSTALNGAQPLSNDAGNSGIDGLVLGSDAGGANATRMRFRKLVVIGRLLNANERAGVLAWAST